MYIDSHAHIFMTVTERNISLDEIISELHENHVDTVLDICGSEQDLEYHKKVNEMFWKNNINFYAAAGIHPQESSNFIDSDISWIRKNSENIIAVGEVGLDFFYDFSPKEIQLKMLRRMIELSIELKKPVLIHGRCGEALIYDILNEYGFDDKKVLFHCYTGDLETAEKILEKQWMLSFSGILTFKKSADVLNIFNHTNVNNMFFETDSPFLAPVPFRGKPNTPGKVKYVYDFAANVLNMKQDVLANEIRKNFNNFFNLNI
ncbi:TatD family hydrolase [bacterium]|nr:TatD family hydrolase [bacterium]